MTEPVDFKLTDADRHSATWKRLSEHLVARLASHRAKNDGDLTELNTAKLRGRIKEVQYLLGLDKTEPPALVAGHGE